MDRRSFLGRLGIGGAAAVTTQLWLPPVSTAVAQPERRVFVPPRGGWPAMGGYPTFTGDITKLFTTENTTISGVYDPDLPDLVPETTCDLMFRGDMPQVQPGDTIEISMPGYPQHTSRMVVQSVEWHYPGETRLRGYGLHPILHPGNSPVGTLTPDEARISRHLVDTRYRIGGNSYQI